VICGLSGGVDSAVAAVLINEAIGDQLTCVFVVHGMLRLDEAKTVVDLFRHHYNIPLGMWMPQNNSSRTRRRHPIPKRAPKPSAACSSTCSTRKQKKLGGADFLAQARSIRCDRERLLTAAPRDHQVAPQCGGLPSA